MSIPHNPAGRFDEYIDQLRAQSRGTVDYFNFSLLIAAKPVWMGREKRLSQAEQILGWADGEKRFAVYGAVQFATALEPASPNVTHPLQGGNTSQDGSCVCNGNLTNSGACSTHADIQQWEQGKVAAAPPDSIPLLTCTDPTSDLTDAHLASCSWCRRDFALSRD